MFEVWGGAAPLKKRSPRGRQRAPAPLCLREYHAVTQDFVKSAATQVHCHSLPIEMQHYVPQALSFCASCLSKAQQILRSNPLLSVSDRGEWYLRFVGLVFEPMLAFKSRCGEQVRRNQWQPEDQKKKSEAQFRSCLTQTGAILAFDFWGE